MRPARPSPLLLLLPPLVLGLACGAPSDPGDTEAGETAASSGQNTVGATDSSGEPGTGAPTTGDGDTTADASTDASASATTGAPGTDSSTAPSTGDATTGDATTGAAEELPPIDSAEALEAWLAGGAYKQWAAESSVHPSTGPHGGNVRTYVNAIALASLAAQQAEHPEDTAVVKELYGNSMDTLIGYAVMRKTAPQSQGGANWYWYERINATIYADGLDVPLCSNCHGAGADYILTPYPLQ